MNHARMGYAAALLAQALAVGGSEAVAAVAREVAPPPGPEPIKRRESDPERLAKAEAKRARKAAQRLKVTGL